jgi:hypothetical protein
VNLPGRRLATVFAASALALAGCGTASSGAGSASSGVLTGVVRTYGGPDRGGSPAANGVLNADVEVTVQRAGESATSVRTNSVGRFTVSLAAGTYLVNGCGGQGGSATNQVVIRSGETTQQDIACQVP